MQFRIESFYIVDADSEIAARKSFVEALKAITVDKKTQTANLSGEGERIYYSAVAIGDAPRVEINEKSKD